MTLDKEDQAVIRSIVIPPHNELLKKISDLEAEVKTLRAQLQQYEAAPIIPTSPERPAAPSRPAGAPPRSRLPPDEENPYASSKVLPRLGEWWEKQYLTAEECNRIEGILSGVPGRLDDPKGKVTRYEAFNHKRERGRIAGWTMVEAKSRGLALSEKEWGWLVNMYKASAA